MLKHLLSTSQFDPIILDMIMKRAAALEELDQDGGVPQTLCGKRLACLFYEPSTRTRLSFEAAMLALGGSVVSTENAAQFSSAAKGETIEDSIRVIGSYVHGIVIRHPTIGTAAIAAEVSSVPIFNAGDGIGEHPTQALLDLYTIKKELGRFNGLTVTMVGDLLHGRTIHSLLNLLALYDDNRIRLVSPKRLALQKYRIDDLPRLQEIIESDVLEPHLSGTDVLYVTRIQKERFESTAEYDRLKNCYCINQETLKRLNPGAIIMHPLPRVDEIAPEVDSDPRAAYFRQAKNGLYVRMALLEMMLR